jgi:exodeoxyribonuclease VII large subunit
MPSGAEIGVAAAPVRNVYSVSRLNREVRLLLERDMGVLWVQGELSNFSQPTSGHWYFSLKDRDAQVRCAMFRARNLLVGFTPRAGAQLLVRGRLSVYEPRGEYQLLVEHLEEAGLGALQREFERLKSRLSAEGLFAPERKRALPRYPRRIGLITSPSGAALRDILHVLARRYRCSAVLIYPTSVQGAAAVPELVAALRSASARAECDVLILARGGGSLEDLWAFNDERVARAIHACALPVVSAVGHEIDFTIADFVADVRAPTPSAAAELVAPDGAAFRAMLDRTAQRLKGGIGREVRDAAARLAALTRRLGLAHPGARLNQQMQRLDDLTLRLGAATRLALGSSRVRTERLDARLQRAEGTHLARAGHRLALCSRALDAVSPLATLSRGFAIVTRADGTLLTDAALARAGEDIEARLGRGTLLARVTGRK